MIVSARHALYDGTLEEVTRENMALGYRTSLFAGTDSVITSAVFGLQKGERQEIEEKMQHYLSLRKEKQPLEYPSAGSTFKRPAGQFAGKLIQESGLKGARVGEAQVSEKHSGFVINRGNATSEEITELIQKVQQTVLEKTGYWLSCEVKYLPFEGTK